MKSGYIYRWIVILNCILLFSSKIFSDVRDSIVCKEGLNTKRERIYDGIDLIFESCTKPLYKAFISKVEIANANYDVVTTPSNLIYSELQTFASATGSIVATNGGFFGPEHGGWFMSYGKESGKFVDDENTSVLAFGKNEGKGVRVEIFPPEHVMPKGGGAPSWIHCGVTGMPVLIWNGEINTKYPPDDLVKFKKGEGSAETLNQLWTTNHPRTGFGISKDNSWILMVVVDGRQKDWSRGMKVGQLAQLMKEYGVWKAINLDGGCSSAMWVAGKGGVINSQCIQHGKIRKTATHIGIVSTKIRKGKGTMGSIFKLFFKQWLMVIKLEQVFKYHYF